MTKLYFRYGGMSAGKSVSLLIALFQYKTNGKKALLIKPEIDKRNGSKTVWSRVEGLSRDADIVLGAKDLLSEETLKMAQDYDCIFVDEAQFLQPSQVEQLSLLSIHVPVICYGLRTDYRGQLFSGARALFQWADVIEEIKNVCKYCKHKSTHNLRIAQVPKPTNVAKIQLGAEDVYVGVCKSCFYEKRSPQDPNVQKYNVHSYPEIVIE